MIALAALTAWAAPSSADVAVCDGVARGTGPIRVGLQHGALGTPRDPCVRTQVALTPGGSLLVDTADLYGRIQAAVGVDARFALSERAELFGRLEPLRLDNVIAPLAAGQLSLGAAALGATYTLTHSARHVVTAHGQATLALGGYANARPLGLDAGVSAAYAIPNGAVHGAVVVYGQTMLGRGPAATKLAVQPRVGVTQRITRRGVAAVLDLPMSVGWTGGLDHLGVAAGLRFGTAAEQGARGAFTELGVLLPLAGRDRATAAAELRVGWRFR